MENVSSSDLLFENVMPYTFYSSSPIFTLHAGEKKTLQVKTLRKLKNLTLRLKALKAFSAPKEQVTVQWNVVIE
ncbi:MAG: Sb-PDE family phosphodiesterase [Flavobacteriaceae bacterium]